MTEEYWLKYGFKENGELVCVRMISNAKPDESFYYDDDGFYKKACNTRVVKLTSDGLDKIGGE